MQRVECPLSPEAFDEYGDLQDNGLPELLNDIVEKLARGAKVLHGE